MTLTRVNVNRSAIAARRTHAYTVKQGGKTIYGTKVEILGPSTLVYQPDKPLSCGARAWIETHSEVVIHDPRAYEETL